MDSTTGLSVFSSICLAAIVIVLIRVALWLKDIAGSLALIACDREPRPAADAAAPARAMVERAAEAPVSSAEIAAVLAVAHRHIMENQGAAI